MFLPEGLCPAQDACAIGPDEVPRDAAPENHEVAEVEEAPPSTWPEPWRNLHARVRTQPRVIITYASLADDVAVAADPERRRLFQTVLSFLGWPAGTTLFWPISFPSNVNPQGQFATDFFAAGVRHFAIRHIICFGEQAAKRALTLYPQEEKTPPVIIHPAPETQALLSLLPHQLHQALANLKGIKLA
ncbi:hypothetical protein [Humidesulfovibrio idahonensis]